MVEAEISSYKIKKLVNFIEKFVKFVFKKIVINCEDEIKYLENQNSKKIFEEMKSFSENKFPVIKYEECLKILNEKKLFRRDHNLIFNQSYFIIH